MENPGSEHVTEILAAVAKGQEGAAEELLSLVYEQLRGLARQQMTNVSPSDSLPPTALVHEAYIRLLGEANPGWKDRRHFFATAARAMRAIIVDQVRTNTALKRGGEFRRVPLTDIAILAEVNTGDVLSLDSALTELQTIDETGAEVVMLRFFAGLTGEETAAALELSPATVDRHWAFEKAWLRRKLAESTDQCSDTAD